MNVHVSSAIENTSKSIQIRPERIAYMVPADLPYTSEEEALADQFAKNSGLLSACSKHPSEFFRAYSRIETIERIDKALLIKGDRLLSLINRNELQKKALIVIVLRNYQDVCRLCGMH